MTNKPTEERLTAYVLGELSESEQGSVEELLKADEDAQRMLEEIRAAVGLSEEALKTQPSVALWSEQRTAINRAIASPKQVAGLGGRDKITPRGLALAASFLMVFGGLSWAVWLGLGLGPARESSSTRIAASPQAMNSGGSGGYLVFGGNADALEEGTTDLNRAASAQEAKRMAEQMPGIERYFITDINSPGASAAIKLDYDDPQIQRQIRALYERTKTPSGAGQGGSAALTRRSLRLQHMLPVHERAEARAISTVAAQSSNYSSGLRQRQSNNGVVVDMHLGRRLSGDELERLKSLGYLNDSGTLPVISSEWIFEQTRPQSSPPDELEIPVRVAALPNFRYQTPSSPQTPQAPGTESYSAYRDNGFVLVGNEPLSTFSIDVDTASYANMRRFLRQGQLPPPDAVRIEELINYFHYDYADPDGEAPFAAHMAVASAPWRPEHRLVRIALKGADMTREERPAANLVFLLDVSGSMKAENKLPLVKRAITLLVRQLTAADRVAIVTYAGSSGLVLPSTRGDLQRAVLDALERLVAGGSTNGGAGIELAYRVATENFVPGGINRVILATDGDFNVGITDRRALEVMIEDKARSGVFLTALGFGMGNLKDSTLETLSNKGNGNYAYIDSFQEARKVFVDELMGTLVTIAKDVKIQVEFNPQHVAAYRLIGYENRALAAQDFNDDTKDAGEIGAGHTVTVLYEIVPAGMTPPGPSVDPLRYRRTASEVDRRPVATAALPAGVRNELLTLKVRYKEPEGSTSKLLTFHLTDPGTRLASAPADFKFVASVACFGQMLRQSPHVAAMDYNRVMALAEDGMATDLHGYRAEFIDLLRMARPLVASTYRTSQVPQTTRIDLEVLNFQQVSDGTYKVRIRSASRRGWYSEGDSFESYQLLSIDPDTGCIVVFDEKIGWQVEICRLGVDRP